MKRDLDMGKHRGKLEVRTNREREGGRKAKRGENEVDTQEVERDGDGESERV